LQVLLRQDMCLRRQVLCRLLYLREEQNRWPLSGGWLLSEVLPGQGQEEENLFAGLDCCPCPSHPATAPVQPARESGALYCRTSHTGAPRLRSWTGDRSPSGASASGRLCTLWPAAPRTLCPGCGSLCRGPSAFCCHGHALTRNCPSATTGSPCHPRGG